MVGKNNLTGLCSMTYCLIKVQKNNIQAIQAIYYWLIVIGRFIFQTVEKTDLIGLDFLWEVCLHTTDPELAEMAISMLHNMSYSNLAPRFKRVRHGGGGGGGGFSGKVFGIAHRLKPRPQGGGGGRGG